MFKYVIALVFGVLSVSSAFATNCHNNVQQIVVAQPVVTYVQPVRQQFVEVVDNNHYQNQAIVQRVVVNNHQRQQVVVARVVNNNHHNNVQAVRVQKVVVQNNNRNRGRSVQVQKSVIINR